MSLIKMLLTRSKIFPWTLVNVTIKKKCQKQEGVLIIHGGGSWVENNPKINGGATLSSSNYSL